MKNFLLLLSILIFQISTAQDKKDNFDDNDDNEYGVVLKKENNTFTESHINNVNPDALRYFINNFEEAEEIKWVIDESGASAEFIVGEKNIVLRFDAEGNVLSTRKNYSGKLLDPMVAKYAKRTAGKNYTVNLVTEIVKGNITTYEISLENKFYWCIVRIKGNKAKGYEVPGRISIMRKG